MRVAQETQERAPLHISTGLDRLLFPKGRLSADPVTAWADRADRAAENAIGRCFEKVKADWKLRYPDGNFGDNRLQLIYRAKRIAYDEFAAADPEFRAKWEKEVAHEEPIPAEERYGPQHLSRLLQTHTKHRTPLNEQLTGVVNYLAARAAVLTGTTYVVMAIGDFGKGRPNALV